MRIDPETLILRALLDGEAYATEIIGRIHTLSGGKLSISMGTIQPTLQRMWTDGLLGREEREPGRENRSGRRRLYYWLSRPTGMMEAQHRLRALHAFANPPLDEEYRQWSHPLL